MLTILKYPSRLHSLRSQISVAEVMSELTKLHFGTNMSAKRWSLNRRYKSTVSVSEGYTVKDQTKKDTASITDDSEDDFDKPIKFSTSKAASWRSENHFYSHPSGDTKPVKYQALVVNLSLAAFIIYFLVLREENDIDEKLSGPLFNSRNEIKIKKLEKTLKYKYTHGETDTADMEEQLKKLKKQMEIYYRH